MKFKTMLEKAKEEEKNGMYASDVLIAEMVKLDLEMSDLNINDDDFETICRFLSNHNCNNVYFSITSSILDIVKKATINGELEKILDYLK